MLDEFRRLYRSADRVRIFRAPGRVNLIGEHTDYNLGFVLPMALQLATFVASSPNPDGMLRIFSEHKQQMREWPLEQIPELQPERNWTDYPLGVARELLRRGFRIEPANLLIRSTVPEGSGLSSSAALEVSCGLALLNGRTIEGRDLARLCQSAEHQFVGIPSGIMDQYVSIFGRENAAIELDCRSLEHRLTPLPAGIALVAVNTNVKHALAGSAYKVRVQECAAAARLLGASSLRDVTPEQFAAAADSLPELIMRRARHVITENQRVGRFVDASRRRDLPEMGKLLVESHSSLRWDYEVSCPELDFLVETALGLDGVWGARMTGGGFGGCIVALLQPEALAALEPELRQRYQREFGRTPEIYICEPSNGAAEVTDFETVPAAA